VPLGTEYILYLKAQKNNIHLFFYPGLVPKGTFGKKLSWVPLSL